MRDVFLTRLGVSQGPKTDRSVSGRWKTGRCSMPLSLVSQSVTLRYPPMMSS